MMLPWMCAYDNIRRFTSVKYTGMMSQNMLKLGYYFDLIMTIFDRPLIFFDAPWDMSYGRLNILIYRPCTSRYVGGHFSKNKLFWLSFIIILLHLFWRFLTPKKFLIWSDGRQLMVNLVMSSIGRSTVMRSLRA